LIEIMAALREPESGCPWDIKQDFSSIANYTVEEAYEVADAIARGDMHDLRDELGDLLFQVVFHARMATEAGAFGFDDVVEAICTKLVNRHPHVFGDVVVKDEVQLQKAWEQQKRVERENKQTDSVAAASGILDGIAATLPALRWAEKLQKRAAQHGFDWPEIEPVFGKLDEEIGELQQEIPRLDNQQRIEDEMGDVLFACVNLARHLKVDPEQALRGCNRRFMSRFAKMEQLLERDGRVVDSTSLQELERYWQESKKLSTR
jgi:nucleoside triphosphate diphosphatase